VIASVAAFGAHAYDDARADGPIVVAAAAPVVVDVAVWPADPPLQAGASSAAATSAVRPGAPMAGAHRPRTRPLDARTARTVPPPDGQATKYLAWGWWQMMAEVVCSGWYWKPVSAPTSTPIRDASSSEATVRLSSRAGQAG